MSKTPTQSEVELKLLSSSVTPLRAIARTKHLGPYRLEPRGVAQLRTTYLDTAQRSLQRNAVALRLRRRGGAWELTAKWAGKVRDAIHTRREINVALPQAPSLPFRLPEGEIADELHALVLGRPLRPILVTAIRRQLFDLIDPAGHIAAELALDTVRHGRDENDLRAPYFEVEVEQRTATLDELRSLRQLLQNDGDLRPTSDSKLQRARQEIFGARRDSNGEGPLTASDTWARAARKLAATQLARLRAGDPRLRARGDIDAETLHQARVATRRLRALMRLFDAVLPERLRTHGASELRWLGSTLGAVRDLDVQLQGIAAAVTAAELGAVLDDFRQQLGRRRDAAVIELQAALRSPRYTRLLLRLERFSLPPTRGERSPVALSLQEAGASSIEEAYDALRRGAGRALRNGDADSWHKLRIRCRRLRYTLEFLAPALDRHAPKLIARLTAFQDLLGEANDQINLAHGLRAYTPFEACGAAPASPPFGASADAMLLRAGRAHERFRRRWKRDLPSLRGEVRALLKFLRHAAPGPQDDGEVETRRERR